MPVIGAYLAQLEQRLSAAGINAPLYLFQSNGGVLPPLKAAQLPVRLLLSGPAGGALAVRTLGNLGAEANLVGIDMGGTSFDVCVVESGTTREITQGEVANCPVRVPMTEIRTISAGGGSIACVDSAGRALVGPHSAGAIPGPAAYGHGGQHATVTDANVVLGRLSPAQFLDGEMPLDVDAATQVVNTTVAEPLNISPEDAAAGVLRVAVAQMAAAIRLSLFEKGLDPRDFALMSFGGAAGLHAAEVAEELGASRVLYPADSATLSAWGMLHADITHDLAATRLLSVTAKTAATINELVAPLVEMATASLHDEGLADDDIHLSLAADMRYRGQAYEIPVPWDALSVSPEVVESACARFHAMHEASFAHSDSNATPELLTVRVRGVGRLTQPGKLSNHPAQSASVVSPRRVYHAGAWQQLPVYTRAHLADVFASEAFHGPLVVEDRHTTIVVPDGWAISAADAGCLMAQRIRADGPTTAASAEDQSA